MFVILMQSKSTIETPSVRLLQQELQQNPAHNLNKQFSSAACLDSEQSIRQSNFEEGLRAKFQRLRQFIYQLGELRTTPINSDVLQQLEIEEEVYLNVGPETVTQQAQKRIEKMTKTRKLKRNWSICDLKILIWLICKHSEQDGLAISEIHNASESWELISSLIPGTTAQSCLFKWLSLKRHKITLHSWSQEEEKILIELENKHAESRNKWKYISEELYTLNPKADKIYRHPKQCREHYASFLDPQIKKGPWTKHEDVALLTHIIENGGEKKWCKLVKILEGRTENAIKNRFQLIFAKLRKKKENKNKLEIELISDYVRDNGGVIPPIKKLSQSSENLPIPKPSVFQLNPIMQEKEHPLEPTFHLPIIPLVNFFPSCRISGSAFTPFLHQPLYQKLPDRVYYELAGKQVEQQSDSEHQLQKKQ